MKQQLRSKKENWESDLKLSFSSLEKCRILSRLANNSNTQNSWDFLPINAKLKGRYLLALIFCLLTLILLILAPAFWLTSSEIFLKRNKFGFFTQDELKLH